jgi:hypothetical protein
MVEVEVVSLLLKPVDGNLGSTIEKRSGNKIWRELKNPPHVNFVDQRLTT